MFRPSKRVMLVIVVVLVVVVGIVGYSMLHVRRGEQDETEVKFRGVVISWPDLGVLGISGVNVQIDEILSDPTHHLKVGDVATVTMPTIPPFVPHEILIGDRVEVFGVYSTTEMPDLWSNTGDHWIGLTSDSYYLRKI